MHIIFVIDVLDLTLLPGERSPAARILAGIGADHEADHAL
jgi:hypothetical protein